MTIRSGEVVGGRYVIEDLLAQGGMADVYRARDVLSNRRVAIKVLRSDGADARRFGLEGRMLARLDHPNLVRLLDAGHDGRDPYLVMELVEGPTLEDRLAQGRLAVAELHRIGHDIAEALAYVHGEGVIHRDVKPSNILLTPDGRALLADFGVARLTGGAQETDVRVTVGTVAYLAPEQVGGTGVGPAADTYALGLVLLEALSGRPAFTGTNQELVAARMARDPEIPTDLPAPWPRLVWAMTRRNPGARPTAATVAARIAAATPGEADLDTAEADMTAVIDATATGAEAAGAAVPAGTAVTEIAPPPEYPMDEPRHRFPPPDPGRPSLAWLFGALTVLAVIAAFAVAPTGDGQGGDAPASSEHAAARPALTTTTSTMPRRMPATTSTTAPTTTSTTVTTSAPAVVPVESEAPAPPAAANCADLEARRQAIEAEKQQVEETYRDDPQTRERLKQQLEDERQALDDQRDTLGC